MKLIKKAVNSEIGNRYIHDRIYRGRVGIYQGMTVNFIYAVFRMIIGLIYSSEWLISSAAYFLLLGIMRAGLGIAYRRKEDKGGLSYEYRCFRLTAWILLLLNIIMGYMIFLTVRTNPVGSYPGYTIYASATYTFYMITLSIINLFKFRKMESPVLSAAKILNFVSAMMSIFGLQNAMISTFSPKDYEYRVLMNTLTGTGVYIVVIATAVFMIISINRKIKNKNRHG